MKKLFVLFSFFFFSFSSPLAFGQERSNSNHDEVDEEGEADDDEEVDEGEEDDDEASMKKTHIYQPVFVNTAAGGEGVAFPKGPWVEGANTGGGELVNAPVFLTIPGEEKSWCGENTVVCGLLIGVGTAAVIGLGVWGADSLGAFDSKNTVSFGR